MADNRPRKSEQRKEQARKVRLPRLVHLRQIGAPKWIVKSEQVALVLNSCGKRHYGLSAGNRSALEEDLYERHVVPLLDQQNQQ